MRGLVIWGSSCIIGAILGYIPLFGTFIVFGRFNEPNAALIYNAHHTGAIMASIYGSGQFQLCIVLQKNYKLKMAVFDCFSDLRMSMCPLQSSALPTELSKACVMYVTCCSRHWYALCVHRTRIKYP